MQSPFALVSHGKAVGEGAGDGPLSQERLYSIKMESAGPTTLFNLEHCPGDTPKKPRPGVRGAFAACTARLRRPPWWRNPWVWGLAAGCAVLVALVVALSVVLTEPQGPTLPYYMPLPMGDLADLASPPANGAPPGGEWNIVKLAFGANNSKVFTTVKQGDTRLRVAYPAGSYSPSAKDAPTGGLGFYACPGGIFLADDVVFRYSVAFAPNFEPNRGGKLPGLYIGPGCAAGDFAGASGGCHTDSASVRLAFRPEFDAEAYVYLPQGRQDPSYSRIPGSHQDNPDDAHTPCTPNPNGGGGATNVTYGDSLWRGQLRWQKDIYNNVEVRVRVNTFKGNGEPETDGVLEVTINEVTTRFDRMVWRLNPQNQVSALLFSTFFGGSSPKAATPVDTFTTFKNMTLEKLA